MILTIGKQEVDAMSELVVVTFGAQWGLPTAGPFALKLVKWLDLAGIPYRQRFEENSAKGPKKKNPWIELDGEAIGDTEIIIDMLSRRSGFDIDSGLSAAQRATGLAVRRMVEEHFHMVFEWELFVHPGATDAVRDMAVGAGVPRPLASPVAKMFSRQFQRQLYARGMARHDDAIIFGKGRADIDAVETLLGDKPFLLGDRPAMADVSAYGLIAPMAAWPMRTPVADYIKTRRKLLAYLDRMGETRADQRLAA
jgi:glutathione S-transferase